MNVSYRQVSINLLNVQLEIVNSKISNDNMNLKKKKILQIVEKCSFTHMRWFVRLFDKVVFCEIEMKTHLIKLHSLKLHDNA